MRPETIETVGAIALILVGFAATTVFYFAAYYVATRSMIRQAGYAPLPMRLMIRGFLGMFVMLLTGGLVLAIVIDGMLSRFT